MAGELNLYYWDACIFYEVCNADQADPQQRAAIDELLKDNQDRRNRIFTSVFTHTEVVPKKLAAGAEQKYWACFGSTYFFDQDVDRQTLLLAREIKDYYYRQDDPTEGTRIMQTGDAIHLATAIVHGATELHTRDRSRKKSNVPLLGLDQRSPSGKICGAYDLTIRSPMAAQGSLDV